MLTKNIKRAQKKQGFLDEEIETIEALIEENSEIIERMTNDMHELTDISEDNVNNYNNMLLRIKELE
jgi:methyl-accepting chemotaxis protein